MNQSDQQIIQLLQSGDKQAIGQLYDRYADSLYGVLRQMLRDEPAAQDVLQDTFVKVWKNGHRYDPQKATLFTWLIRIARNTALDYRRASQTRSGHEIHSAAANVGKVEPALNPDHLDLPEHLAKLEPKYGRVLHALFFLGLSQQEASEKLDIPLGTVKSRLRVGLRELRKVFDDRRFLVFFALLFFEMIKIGWNNFA